MQEQYNRFNIFVIGIVQENLTLHKLAYVENQG